MLLDILLAFFVDHSKSRRLVEGFNSPLGTLSTRVAAAHALGLLSEREFKECEILRKIRNLFAHHVHTSFEDQQVRDLCKCLTMAAHDYDQVVVDAPGRYVTAAVALLLNLNNLAFYVAKKRSVPVDWPT
jgi:mannitol operon repressor